MQRLALVLLVLFFLAGCKAQTSLPQDLDAEVKRFVESMQNQNWELIYRIKGEHFAKKVPYQLFSDVMDRESKLLLLLGYEVKEVKSSADTLILNIEYRLDLTNFFQAAKEVNQKSLKGGLVVLTVPSVWTKNGDEWEIERSGLGQFFSLLDYE